MCLLTIDNWLEVNDMSPSERHGYFRQDIHIQLLNALLKQCAYPESYNGNWDDLQDIGVDEFIFKVDKYIY